MKKIYCVTALIETSPQALPLGASCIASAINNHPSTKDEFYAEVFDFSMEEKVNVKKIAAELCSVKPYAVCFSIYVWNRYILEELRSEIKNIDSSIISLCGGPEVTANPDSFKSFDYAVSGEGEFKTCEILCCLSSVEFNREFNELSSPYLDGTLDPQKYGGALWELARGCPFKCTYCYESKGEKKVRYFPIERITRELELFAKKKIPQIFVLDPTYNANKKRALDMLSLIKRITPDTFYYFEARAEFIDRPMARAFSDVRCSLQFGLQSCDENVLKNVNRTFNRKLFEKNVSFLNEEGCVFGFDLIYGLPGDTLSGFKKSIDFALSLYPNNLELFGLSVLPGTQLFDDAQKFNLVYQKESPYHLLYSPTFSKEDMIKAEKISKACSYFYNEGRAVPWFNSVLNLLRMKSSVFFSELSEFGFDFTDISFASVQKTQLEFIHSLCKKKNLLKQYDVCRDIIVLNNAISNWTACGKESVVELKYHPDDLMSEYSMDINFFSKNCGVYKNKTKVFGTKSGPDWKVIK